MTDGLESSPRDRARPRSWKGRKRLGHWLLWPGIIAFFVSASIESGGISFFAICSVVVGFILVVEARVMRWRRRE